MSKKKISFSKKPSSIEDSAIIDNWVSGSTEEIPKPSLKEKRFTIVIPENLYRKLKIKCAKNDLKLKEFIIDSLEKNLID